MTPVFVPLMVLSIGVSLYIAVAGTFSFIALVLSVLPSTKRIAPIFWRGILGSFVGFSASACVVVVLILGRILFLPLPEWVYVWRLSAVTDTGTAVPDMEDYAVIPGLILIAGVLIGTVLAFALRKAKTV